MEIANAAYNLPFWDFTIPMKKKVLFIIQRAQQPLEVCSEIGIFINFNLSEFQVTVGNIYPMTLELFQSLLNTAYTFFNVAGKVLN